MKSILQYLNSQKLIAVISVLFWQSIVAQTASSSVNSIHQVKYSQSKAQSPSNTTVTIISEKASSSDTVTFNEYPSGTLITNQYLNMGVLFSGVGGNPPPEVYDYGPTSYGRVLIGHNWYDGILIKFVEPLDSTLYRPVSSIAFDNPVSAEVDFITIKVYGINDSLLFTHTSASPERVEINLGNSVAAYMILDDSAATAYILDNLTLSTSNAPSISVSPNSFAVSLQQGDSTTRIMTIGNTGTTILTWSIGSSTAMAEIASAQLHRRTESEITSIAESVQGQTNGTSRGTPTVSPYRWQEFLSAMGTKRLLAWAGYTDKSAGGEFENTVNAIKQYYTDFALDTTSTTSANVFSSLIADKDIFLVPEQENTSDLTSLGSSFAATLDSFVQNGKTVIVLDHGGIGLAATSFLNATGLLSIVNPVNSAGYTAVVHDVGSPLVVGLPSQFAAMNGSNYHTSSNGQKIVRELSTGDNMVTQRNIGSGRVIYIGMDFYSYNSDMARLLANAVQSTASTSGFITVSPQSGTVAPGSSQDVTVKINAKTLTAGNYSGNISITNNDSANNPKNVPVNLTVTPGPSPTITVTPSSFSLSLQQGDSTTQTITIGNIGVANLTWNVAGGSTLAPQQYTLSSSVGYHFQNPDAGMSPRLSFAKTDFRTPPLTATLGNLSGKTIGVTDTIIYNTIISDLRSRGATIVQVTFPITSLAGIDVLGIDDAIYSASPSDVAAIRTWLQAGKGLLVQGDDVGSIANINSLLSGTGIQETSYGNYRSAYLTTIFPHSTTVGVDTINASAYGSYATVNSPAQVLVLDTTANPHAATSQLGLGRVIVSCNEIQDMLPGKNRLFANRIYDWLAGATSLWSVTPTSGTVAPGLTQDVTVKINAKGLGIGTYNDNIAISNNDPANNPKNIPLTVAVTPGPAPAITVSPASFNVSLQAGDSTTRTLTIGNAGAGTLTWNAASTYSAVASAANAVQLKGIVQEQRVAARVSPASLLQAWEENGVVEARYSRRSDDQMLSAVGKSRPVQRDVSGDNGSLKTATSSGVIENFETGIWPWSPWIPVGGGGTIVNDAYEGIRAIQDPEWHYRTDVVVGFPGEQLSMWVKCYSNTGRFYLGFGATAAGAWSLVAGVNTSSLILQTNAGYNFSQIAEISQSWIQGTWYRLEVSFLAGGAVLGKLYAADGTTLLNTVSATITGFAPGGIAIRGFGSFVGDYIHTGTANWLSITPQSGTVAPGSSQNVTVGFSTRELNVGSYNNVISITNNDPFNNPKNIPVSMGITGPAITSVVPNAAAAGQTLNVAITGQNTSFRVVQGSSTVDVSHVWLSRGSSTINASTVTVSSATNLTANFTIPSGVTTGSWHLNIEQPAGNGIVTLYNGFIINPIAIPTITSVIPDSASQGQTMPVTITGQNTSFRVVQASSTVDVNHVWFSQGSSTINATSVTVSSATYLTANFTIPTGAPTGLWNVNVEQPLGMGIVTLNNGFRISVGGSPIPTPRILFVRDIPNDNGKQVFVRWKVDQLAVISGIARFGVWRKDSVWTFLKDSVLAVNDSVFQFVAPTIYDSTKVSGMRYSVFRVSAHNVNPAIFTISQPDSGYSLDNLVPSVPKGVRGTIQGGGTIAFLQWNKVPEKDLRYYAVYRSETAGFAQVDSTTFVGASADTTYRDSTVVYGTKYYYRVVAFDWSGNRSDPSDQLVLTITSVGRVGSEIPKEFSLAQNYPNPFNPTTIIRYGVPTRSQVKVEVFNTIGQRVATLLNDERAAGYYEVEWRAAAASGTYIYRIEAVASDNPNNAFVQVKKMVLVR